MLLHVVPSIRLLLEPAADGRVLVSSLAAATAGRPGALATDPPEAEITEDPLGGNGYPKEPVRLVLVDDVEGMRNLVRLLLEGSGFFDVVGEAATGKEGIEAAKDAQPDLVLLDLSMPDMDGLEALPRILEVAPESKVAIYSGFEATRLEGEARRLGAIGYIEKGIEPQALVDELVELLKAAA